MIIELPWPPRHLSPNARVHWAQLSRQKRAYRHAAYFLAVNGGRMKADRLNVSLQFCPPDARRRDLDNLIASMKSALDGISDAVGVDDSRWSLSASIGPQVPNGAVIVTVTP